MIALALIVYFFVLLGALVIGGSGSVGMGELAVLAMLSVICVAILQAWSTLITQRVEGKRETAEAPREPAALGMRVPPTVLEYLRDHHMPFNWYAHGYAATAGDLARALDVARDGVASPVMVRADDAVWMAVLPASEQIDLDALREILHVRRLEVMADDELARLFPGYEIGAEPPLGRMFHIPTIVETDLTVSPRICFYGGRHDETLEVACDDYVRVERPLVAHFGHRLQPTATA